MNEFELNTVIDPELVNNNFRGLADGSLDDNNNSLELFRSEGIYDHVVSGCVWTGDNYGGNRLGSMTSGVVMLAGVRVPVAAISGRTFTASKDTYIDVDNSGTVYYTEASNNAASPALTAGRIRIAIVVTGASSIASLASINQGQTNKVLPIISSNQLAVTDSLGNMICNRSMRPGVIGYGECLTGNASAGSTPTAIPGMQARVLVPTSRRIKVTAWFRNMYCDAAGGAVALAALYQDGTEVAQAYAQAAATPGVFSASIMYITNPTTTSLITYDIKLRSSGGGNAHADGNSSSSPLVLVVELV